MWNVIIPAIVSLLSTYLGSQNKPKEYGLSTDDINKLMDTYRKSGMAGIAQLGGQERANATSRIAASGLDPTLALEQSVFNPILNNLSGARANLEGQLAQQYGNLLTNRAAGQQVADLSKYQSQQNLYSGLGDLGGVASLYGLQNPSGWGFGGNSKGDPNVSNAWMNWVQKQYF